MATATVQFQRNGPLALAETPHYWYPQRFGVEFAPRDFRARLKREFGPDIEVTWWKTGQRWLIWQRDPSIQYHGCPGWSMKMVWKGWNDRFLPLDERVFANLFARQLWRYPGAGKGYFARIESELEREQATRVKDSKADVNAKARELADDRKIKNIGHGNKFALHHDGTMVPSRGELNWHQELQRTRGLS